MGGGDTYNASYVSATQTQATSQEHIAMIQGKYDLKTAQEQSKAVIEQAKYDYQARIKEATLNQETQMKALDVRSHEADLQFKVDWKQANNDATRAEASIMNAQAGIIKADATATKADAYAKKTDYMYSNQNNNSNGGLSLGP